MDFRGPSGSDRQPPSASKSSSYHIAASSADPAVVEPVNDHGGAIRERETFRSSSIQKSTVSSALGELMPLDAFTMTTFLSGSLEAASQRALREDGANHQEQ
jgi:hypothetical protein